MTRFKPPALTDKADGVVGTAVRLGVTQTNVQSRMREYNIARQYQ